MEDSIVSSLAGFIATQILKQPRRQIRQDEALISSGLVDSFSLVDLALYVEDTFGVHIDDTELNTSYFDNLEQLAGLIRQRQAA